MEELQNLLRGHHPSNPRINGPPKPRRYVHREDRAKVDPETLATHTIIWHGVDPIEQAREQGRSEATRFWLIAFAWLMAGIVALIAISRLGE